MWQILKKKKRKSWVWMTWWWQIFHSGWNIPLRMKQQSRPHPHTQDRTEYNSDRADKGFALSLHSHCYLKTGTFWQGGTDRFQQRAAPSARNLYLECGLIQRQTAPKQKPNKARVNTVHLWYSKHTYRHHLVMQNVFRVIFHPLQIYFAFYIVVWKRWS